MEAKVQKQGDVLIIHLKGQMSFESADSFKEQCMKHLKNEKIVFNLENLSFVGSSGITPFLDAILFLQKNASIKLCRVGAEFARLFRSLDSQIQFYENERSAIYALFNPTLQHMPQNFIESPFQQQTPTGPCSPFQHSIKKNES